MKKGFLFFTLAGSVIFAFNHSAQCQTMEHEKTITINDIRNLGVIHYDTSTVGHTLDEVVVDRSLYIKPEYMDGNKDTLDDYQIHFFKMYENRLRNYQMNYGGKKEFDKASYKWLNDTIVSVTLFNSETNENKNLKLVQTFTKGSSAGLLTDDLVEKK